ncbi:hypothetical protein CcI49_02110 [Frankia sp. CcI49]|uniref:hypothetical protein n=1 Tax=unclassified Frankia TaxID=2632575 RepID=UPI0006CA19DA|nr:MULTISPECIES: hypothetical protein [unclassified Frankia]KPM55537.1 hypothetical protein ACG83_09455 [Frankia sp. R43]ONH62213.1 hypothetical protein CcI49_02110 [Frankia sp. CcI49]
MPSPQPGAALRINTAPQIGTAPQPSVPNRYLQAVEAALAVAVAGRQAVSDAFDVLFVEATAGGWQGRVADDWWRQAADQRAAALGNLEACVTECRGLLAGQSELVGLDDPRARHPGPARAVPMAPAGRR